MPIKVGMVSLGCSKNQVDAERMLFLLQEEGFVLSADPEDCDVVIVNTCGFIEDAKKESIDSILEFAARKEEGRHKAIVVTGCLAERYRQEVAENFPEVDVVLGIGGNGAIARAIRRALSGEKVVRFGDKAGLPLEGERILANPGYYAYLKVADGCDNRCSYCAIPLIRGDFRSRPAEQVVEEAKALAGMGVTELNVVAQDTTRYGEDLYGEPALPDLLEKLCAIPRIHWVRVLYCYPQRVTDRLLDVMNSSEKLVGYMDIPVQHASGKVLREMNRSGDRWSLEALMEHIRRRVSDVVLRTTLITGFPGETEEDFEELCGFVRTVKFDRLGCFSYSQEEDTPAGAREDQVEESVRLRRRDIVMEMQMEIAEKAGERRVGSMLEVLCEGFDREIGCWYGRSYMDAPDIDTRVYFTTTTAVRPGEYVWVEVARTMGYDLVGRRILPAV